MEGACWFSWSSGVELNAAGAREPRAVGLCLLDVVRDLGEPRSTLTLCKLACVHVGVGCILRANHGYW